MIIVHPLKERVSLDLLHSSGSNPVLTFTTEPKTTEHQVNTEEKKKKRWLKINHVSKCRLAAWLIKAKCTGMRKEARIPGKSIK